MIEELENIARLKARLDRWQTYNNPSVVLPEPPLVTITDSHHVEEQEYGSLEVVTDTKQHLPSVIVPALSETIVARGTILEHFASHIADLQATVEHERAQNEQLTQTVRRAQALHMVTLQSEAEASSPPVPDYSGIYAEPDLMQHSQDTARSKRMPLVTFLASLILLMVMALGVIAYLFYF